MPLHASNTRPISEPGEAGACLERQVGGVSVVARAKEFAERRKTLPQAFRRPGGLPGHPKPRRVGRPANPGRPERPSSHSSPPAQRSMVIPPRPSCGRAGGSFPLRSDTGSAGHLPRGTRMRSRDAPTGCGDGPAMIPRRRQADDRASPSRWVMACRLLAETAVTHLVPRSGTPLPAEAQPDRLKTSRRCATAQPLVGPLICGGVCVRPAAAVAGPVRAHSRLRRTRSAWSDAGPGSALSAAAASAETARSICWPSSARRPCQRTAGCIEAGRFVFGDQDEQREGIGERERSELTGQRARHEIVAALAGSHVLPVECPLRCHERMFA